MADPHQTPLHGTMEELVAAGVQSAAMRCCCGREDCVFLRHNCSVLETVEKDVHTAAKMGQALLARHEAYMASAERDRFDLTARIEQLEMDKKELEAHNARTIEENRSLLDQLELLNTSVADSEVKMRALEATLQSSHQTVRRLEGAVSRAADMERHVASLEMEQMTLQNTLINTQSEARSAVQRWKKAERGISDLQEQLEKMEKEAREERERHVEVMERMERQRAMEKDLNTAAGRLKGAAAAKTFHDGKGGASVVSHFVRDLLQDNANLQLGIAELREMLMNSNDEIQVLREQLVYHQPVTDSDASATSTLRAELEPSEHSPAKVSQELHIHHHYHVTNKADAKKPKKKRQGLSLGVFSPPAMSYPSTPQSEDWRLSQGSPAPALLSHSARDSAPTISMPSNRWSLFSDQPSDFAPSSVPSSPQSNPRNSMFDRGIMEASIPNSPTTSVDPMSPSRRAAHKKQASDTSARSIPIPFTFSARPPPEELLHSMAYRQNSPRLVQIIHEEDSQPPTVSGPTATVNHAFEICDVTPLASPAATVTDESITTESTVTTDECNDGCVPSALSPSPHLDQSVEPIPSSPIPRLHRAQSHESIMSLSNGLDIHTLKVRPSQLTLRPLGATAAGTGFSTVTARPTISRANAEGKRGSVILRDSLGASTDSVGLLMPRLREGSRIVSNPGETGVMRGNPQRDVSSGSSTSTFGRIVGWRPWVTPSTPARESIPARSTARPGLSPGSTGSTTPRHVSKSNTITDRNSSNRVNQDVEIAQTQLAPPTETSRIANLSYDSHDSHTSQAWKERDKDTIRAPGINQPGAVPIPGFYEYWAAHQRRGPPTHVRVGPGELDSEALRDGLGG